MAVVLAMTSVGIKDQSNRVNDWPYTGALRTALEREGVDHFYSSYWLTYRVMFETSERMVGTQANGAGVRYMPYNDAVDNHPNPAWVFRQRWNDPRLPAFIKWTASQNIGIRVIEAGDYAIVITDRKVERSDVPTEIRDPGD